MTTLNIYLNYYYFKLFNNNLTGLRSFLNSIPNINYGGCGLSAYILLCYVNSGYVVGYYDKNHKNKDGFIYNNKSADHLYLYYKGFYYDSEGIYTRKQVELRKSDFSARYNSLYKYNQLELKNSILEKALWNSRFEYRNLLIKLFKIKQ